MDGTKIKHALSLMNERGSGEGAGYAAYGVYPEFADYYALHVFFDNPVETKCHLDALLETWGTIVHDEEIPTYEQPNIRKIHTPWRYFFKPDRALKPGSRWPEEDIVTSIVMKVNTSYEGILIFSSGKNIALRSSVVPLGKNVQVIPPSLVLNSLPCRPTTHASSELSSAKTSLISTAGMGLV